MNNEELKESFLKAKKGNEEAFGKIYDYYYDKLSAYVYRRVLGIEITEDIVSNTFFLVLKNLKKFEWRGAAEFNGWMYRIATNEVNDYFRKKNKYNFTPPNELEDYFYDSSDKMNLHHQVSEKIDLQKDFAEISGVIQELKPKEQSLIHLRFFEEMSITEISEVVKKSESSVRVSLHRALKKIKGRISSEKLSQLS
jgi:RNA polymerase sigma-70 factor (ECF subfamily)